MKKLIFSVLLICFVYMVNAAIIYVPANYSTIQAAVNAASAGDTIIVSDGTYEESIMINTYGLTLESEEGPENCIIKAEVYDYHCIEASLYVNKIEGFTFKEASNCALIMAYGAGEIKNCIFEDNLGDQNGFLNASAITSFNPIGILSHCLFRDNTAYHTVVISSDYLGYNPLVNEYIGFNLFVNNSTTAKDIHIMNASGNYHGVIENNTFIGNSGGIHVYCVLSSADLFIRNCIFYNAGISDDTFYPENIILSYNSFTGSGYSGIYTWSNGNLVNSDPLFCAEEPYKYFLLEGSPCIDAGDPSMTDPDGTRRDMGCYLSTTDIKPLKVDGYSWVSFPRLERDETTNEAEDIVPYLDNIYPFDDITYIDVRNESGIILEWEDGEWSYDNYDVQSTQAFKIDIDIVSEDEGFILPMTGTRLIPDYVIEENFEANTDYWLGYWLPETQNIVDAFGDLWTFVETISAEDWYYDKCSSSRGIGEAVPKSWVTEGKNMEYGKGYIITFNDNFTDFYWSPASSRTITQGYDPIETTYFTYHELPSYEVIDVLDIPSNVIEIGVFQDDVCVGAVAVQDSCEQILVYSQSSGREEIPFRFEVISGRSSLSSPVLAYEIYNELIGEFEPGSVIAGRQKSSIVMFGAIGEPGNEPPSINYIKLHGNYPNPFNPETTISFDLTTENTESTELVIYNMKGQKVKQLVRGQLSSGEHSFIWHGTDDDDKPVSSGLYLYKLKVGDRVFSRKMLLLK